MKRNEDKKRHHGIIHEISVGKVGVGKENFICSSVNIVTINESGFVSFFFFVSYVITLLVWRICGFEWHDVTDEWRI